MKKLKSGNEVSHLCLDIISEILSRLDVETLSRFKCVSRSWRALISDPLFVDLRRQRSMKNTKLLYTFNSYYTKAKPLSFYSIKTGDHHRSEKLPTLSSTHGSISGSFHVSCGLVCFRGLFGSHDVYVCNPSTGELCVLPKTSATSTNGHLGFGYSTRVREYKVVNMFPPRCPRHGAMGCEVLAFSHRTKIDPSSSSWKPLICPRGVHSSESVSANGKIYWLINHRRPLYMLNNTEELILSFDIANDTFSTLPRPPSWPLRKYNKKVAFMVMDGMLCITNKWNMQKKGVLDIWMLEGNCVWTRIYSINLLGLRHIHNSVKLHPECMFGDEIVLQAGELSRKYSFRVNPRYSYNIKTKTLRKIDSSSAGWHCAGVFWESSFKLQ